MLSTPNSHITRKGSILCEFFISKRFRRASCKSRGELQGPKQDHCIARSAKSMDDCLLCCEPITYRIVSECGHDSICGFCIFRMRNLLGDRKCPFCKHENVSVFIGPSPASSSPFVDQETAMVFAKKEDFLLFQRIKSIHCRICNDIFKTTKKVPHFSTYAELEKHLQKQHHQFVCKVCTLHLKLFSHELCLFDSEQELQRHIEKGSSSSYSSIDPHPACRHCKTRLFDKDLLYAHLEKDHFKCHICFSSYNQTYYSNYSRLFYHFEKKHFVCREQECLDKKFIVFSSNLDLRIHLLNEHGGKNMSAQERRKLSTLHMNFQYSRDSSSTSLPLSLTSHIPSSNDYPSLRSAHGLESEEKTETTQPKKKSSKCGPLPFPPQCPAHERRERNAALLNSLEKCVSSSSSSECVQVFKGMSAGLMNSSLSPRHYLSRFLNMFSLPFERPIEEWVGLFDPVEKLLLEIIALLPDHFKRKGLYDEYVQLFNPPEPPSSSTTAQPDEKESITDYRQVLYSSGSIPLSSLHLLSSALNQLTPAAATGGTRGQSVSAHQRKACMFYWQLSRDAMNHLISRYAVGEKSFYIVDVKVRKARKVSEEVGLGDLRDVIVLTKFGLTSNASGVLKNLSVVSKFNYDEEWAAETLSSLRSEDLYLISVFILSLFSNLGILTESCEEFQEIVPEEELVDEFGFARKQTGKKKKKGKLRSKR